MGSETVLSSVGLVLQLDQNWLEQSGLVRPADNFDFLRQLEDGVTAVALTR